MNNFPPSERPVSAGRAAGIVRLIRQICLLRESGDRSRAESVQASELAAAIQELRVAEGDDAVTSAQLDAWFAQETERVANAVVMAELLVPRLREALAEAPAAKPVAIVRESEAEAPVKAVATTRTVLRAPKLKDSLSIPDLLDAMLALERDSRRDASGVKT